MTTIQPEEQSVGVREFRLHIGQHLDDVLRGRRITVTRQGRKIARLLPYEEGVVSEEIGVYNAEQPPPEEADRLVALFAPKVALQVMEQCWQDKSTARRILLQALLKLEDGQL